MEIFVIGAGKLARELLSDLKLRLDQTYNVISWDDRKKHDGSSSVVIHAGSGRELAEAIAFCELTASPLIELSTSPVLDLHGLNIPIVECPNTNILMLKFMNMLAKCGSMFNNYQINIIESHQANKNSEAGTAISMAYSVGLQTENIVSVRDPEQQKSELGIPVEYLDRHAFHRIEIKDEICSVAMETRVFGDSPYVNGVAKIIMATAVNHLENRHYHVMEFIEKDWI